MAEKDFLELVREKQFELWLGKGGGFRNKKKKTICNSCGREMESPMWENPPYYCYKCSDKYEAGNPYIY